MFAQLAVATTLMLTQDTPAALVDKLQCTAFEWTAVDGRERGAIRVPVIVDGEAMLFQLDTASEASMVYGRESAVLGASVGGLEIPPMFFFGKPDQAAGGGTVGLDVFVGRVAVLDYSGRRFCLMTQADFPYALYSRTKWADSALRNGRLFVPITINGEVETSFFFDTGSSLFTLAVDLERWRNLTGLGSTLDASDVVEATAWGEPIRVVGAPMTGVLSIAGVDIPNASAFVRESEPNFLAETQEGADGLIGNAGVWDKVVVIYLGARPRFGIVE